MDQYERQKTTAITAVETALRAEKDPLFTQNTHYLDSCRRKWLSHYQTVRRSQVYYKLPSGKPSISRKRTTPLAAANIPETPDTWPASPTAISSSPTTRALEALEELGYKDLKASDLARLAQYDSFDKEINVMAEVRAYFQVAYKVRNEELIYLEARLI